MIPRLHIDSRALVAALRAAPGYAAAEVRDAFYHVKAKMFKTWWRAAKGRMKIRPKIGLMNRVIGQVFARSGTLGTAELKFLNFSRAFWLHERGGTIRAGGKLLPVPLHTSRFDKGGNLVTRSRGRKQIRRWLEGGKLQVYPTRKGTFLGQRRRGNESPTFYFKLVREVRLRPRLGFFATWNGLMPWARTRLDQALVRAVARFNRRAA